jgi:hypothetical protein
LGIKKVLNSYLSNPLDIYKNIKYRLFVKPCKGEIVFVVGAPRSGTTLIQSVISAHAKITSFDEETGFFMYRDIFSHSFEGISKSAYENICESNLDIASTFKAVADECLKLKPGAEIFLEKTPQHVLCLNRLIRWFPEAKFINVNRDIRDSAVSASKFSGIEQGGDTIKFVNYWNRCISARLNVASENIIDVNYEDFVNNPESETLRIMSFIGVEYDSKQILPKYFSKNKRAGKDGFVKLAEAINGSSVGRWKIDLEIDEVKKIEATARKNMMMLGYL